jgi:hypothetical protein
MCIDFQISRCKNRFQVKFNKNKTFFLKWLIEIYDDFSSPNLIHNFY